MLGRYYDPRESGILSGQLCTSDEQIRLTEGYQRLGCPTHHHPAVLQGAIPTKRIPQRGYRTPARAEAGGLRQGKGLVRPKGRSAGEVPRYAPVHPTERERNIRAGIPPTTTQTGVRTVQSAGRYEPAAGYPADIGREPAYGAAMQGRRIGRRGY